MAHGQISLSALEAFPLVPYIPQLTHISPRLLEAKPSGFGAGLPGGVSPVLLLDPRQIT